MIFFSFFFLVKKKIKKEIKEEELDLDMAEYVIKEEIVEELEDDSQEDITKEEDSDNETSKDVLTITLKSKEPDDATKAAAESKPTDILPKKSQLRYEQCYEAFKTWQTENNLLGNFSEETMLEYFKFLSKKNAPNTLWANLSMLRATIELNDGVDISKQQKLSDFIKTCNVGYTPKKTKSFSEAQIRAFIESAPDVAYLAYKVIPHDDR